jgi:DNA-binding MarR family transcriptional regulator
MAEASTARPRARETAAGDRPGGGRPEGQQRILPLVEHLARVGRRSADACMPGCLRPRHLIALRLLGEHGPMTQHDLGVALSLDASNVVGLLNELEERGLITRRRDPADRRRHIVELSPAGPGDAAQACDQLGQVEDDLFRTLTGDERQTLYVLLARAVESLAPGCDQPCATPSPSPAGTAPAGTAPASPTPASTGLAGTGRPSAPRPAPPSER